MMGTRQEAQSALFYEFSVEAHVPADHMLRAVDRFVDLGGIRQHLAPFYSSTGRPSVDPELMIRILLIGYIMGIRSERRLCEEVHLDLAYRWFCRLELTDPVPDHSTFSKTRHGRFRDSDVVRHLFETVVARCIAEGLASGQRFAADASIIQADASRQNSAAKADWQPDKVDPEEAPRAVREYLATLDDAAFGAASPVDPKFTSHSDPAAQWTGARGGPAYFAYSTNYLIDTDNGVILDVEATRSIRQIGAHHDRSCERYLRPTTRPPDRRHCLRGRARCWTGWIASAIVLFKGKGRTVAKPSRKGGTRSLGVTRRDIDEGGRTRPSIQIFVRATGGEVCPSAHQINLQSTSGMRQIPDGQSPDRVRFFRETLHVVQPPGSVVDFG